MEHRRSVLTQGGLSGHLRLRPGRDGNRTKKTVNGATTTYGYDRTDQLASVDGGPTVVVYNPFGDLTKKPDEADPGTTTTYAYDLAGKLTTIDGDDAGEDATFTFDALGRFRTRTIGSTVETYGYLGTSETVLAIESTGDATP